MTSSVVTVGPPSAQVAKPRHAWSQPGGWEPSTRGSHGLAPEGSPAPDDLVDGSPGGRALAPPGFGPFGHESGREPTRSVTGMLAARRSNRASSAAGESRAPGPW